MIIGLADPPSPCSLLTTTITAGRETLCFGPVDAETLIDRTAQKHEKEMLCSMSFQISARPKQPPIFETGMLIYC